MALNLETIYRNLNGDLFHEDGSDLTSEEYKELTAMWQAEQVKDGNASWDNDPCNWCDEAVCTCHMNLSAWFDLPPMEEDEPIYRQPRGERVPRERIPRPQGPRPQHLGRVR